MKNGDLPSEFIPNKRKIIGSTDEKNSYLPSEFRPSEDKVLGDKSRESEEDSEIESFGSTFQYVIDQLTESDFEISEGFEGFRGSSFVYERGCSILVVSDGEDGVGFDLFSYEGEPDMDEVGEWLHSGEFDDYPDAQNSFHYDLDGEEAYNQVFKVVSNSTRP